MAVSPVFDPAMVRLLCTSSALSVGASVMAVMSYERAQALGLERLQKCFQPVLQAGCLYHGLRPAWRLKSAESRWFVGAADIQTVELTKHSLHKVCPC